MTDLLITLTQKEDNANNVTVAFTMGKMALSKGHSVSLILLSNAVHLAERGYGNKIDIGEPFQPVGELIFEFIAQGGEIKVCSACMKHNGVSEDNLMEDVEIITAEDVISIIMDSKKSLQLN
ncbi:DsrE family protein [Facklamia sp. DSM 111018]|uniref:DsrE family protein n=1 Tax=Facklamia lactis TaxID=2749967 RepID=A0ABS0LPW8_9LACT|nr:DsrE family protein [Facklamia lactis]MBG9986210.1 DsrE family protein [Facklamia lactis]